LLPIDVLAELYCRSPLTNIRGVMVYVVRVRTTLAVNEPCTRSTRLIETLGSSDSCGVTCIRAALTAMDVRSPL
jgi:hypothetical protein